VIYTGYTQSEEFEVPNQMIEAYIKAGMTWWFEYLDPWRGNLNQLSMRAKLGPPKP
jgi:hypothetical protein